MFCNHQIPFSAKCGPNVFCFCREQTIYRRNSSQTQTRTSLGCIQMSQHNANVCIHARMGIRFINALARDDIDNICLKLILNWPALWCRCPIKISAQALFLNMFRDLHSLAPSPGIRICHPEIGVHACIYMGISDFIILNCNRFIICPFINFHFACDSLITVKSTSKTTLIWK